MKLAEPFFRAADPLMSRFDRFLKDYPSKSAGAAAFVADLLFLYQSARTGNEFGVIGAGIGLIACLHLIKFGDPKITAEQQATYVDPQSKRNLFNWVTTPHQYPWETLAAMRMTYMSLMLAGGIGFDRGFSMHAGEIAYSTLALLGYVIKIGVAEKESGSVAIPETQNPFMHQMHRLNAYVQENPNATAGKLWLAGLAPYALEGLILGQPAKVASAIMYFVPDFLTMISKKRAQVLPDYSQTDDPAPKA